MRRFSIPIMGWILIGLLVVGILPFAITAWQVNASRNALISQVQRMHLIAVRSTADRVSGYLNVLNQGMRGITRHPEVLRNPASTATEELLTSLLITQPNIIAAGIFEMDKNSENLVRIARRKEFSNVIEAVFQKTGKERLAFVPVNNSAWLSLREPFSGGRYQLRVVASSKPLETLIQPVEMGDQALFWLVDKEGEPMVGSSTETLELPENLLQQAASRYVFSGADNYKVAKGNRLVTAFAKVEDSDWVVFSRQPSAEAEIAVTQMRKTTAKIFLLTLLVVSLLTLAMYKKIVKPIREVIRAQQELAGDEDVSLSGSEIEQLQQSFNQIEASINDREALSEVFLDRYQVIDVLGSGAMGTVFRGWDPKLKREVALKTIKVDGKQKKDRHKMVKSLIQEAITVAGFTHQNIVTVYDAVDADDVAYIAMEFVKGMSLEEYLRQYSQLPVEQVVPLAIAILRGLAAAHRHGVVHRDIKPGNILLGDDATIKVTDFGVAEPLSDARLPKKVIAGSPRYLAPEVYKYGYYTEKCDIYSVGVLLYVCLAGSNPFSGRTLKQTAQLIVQGSFPPINNVRVNLPSDLVKFIHRLMATEPEERPDNAGIAADLLEARFNDYSRWKPYHINDETRTKNKTLDATVVASSMSD